MTAFSDQLIQLPSSRNGKRNGRKRVGDDDFLKTLLRRAQKTTVPSVPDDPFLKQLLKRVDQQTERESRQVEQEIKDDPDFTDRVKNAGVTLVGGFLDAAGSASKGVAIDREGLIRKVRNALFSFSQVKEPVTSKILAQAPPVQNVKKVKNLVSELSGGEPVSDEQVSRVISQIPVIRRLIGVEQAAKSFIRGDQDVDVVRKEAGKSLEDQLKNLDPDVRDLKLFQLGEQAQQLARKHFRGDPRLVDEFFASKVPSGLGSMAFFMLGGAASAATGGALSPAVSAALIGAASEAGSQFDRALKASQDEETAVNAALLANIGGLTEGAPIGRIFNRFDKASGGLLKSSIAQVLREGIAGSLEEAVQEVLQTKIGNEIAQRIAKEDPKLAESLVESGEVSGVIGFIASAAATAGGLTRGRIRRRRATKALAEIERIAGEQGGEAAAPGPEIESETPSQAPGRKEPEAGKSAGKPVAPGDVAVERESGPTVVITRKQALRIASKRKADGTVETPSRRELASLGLKDEVRGRDASLSTKEARNRFVVDTIRALQKERENATQEGTQPEGREQEHQRTGQKRQAEEAGRGHRPEGGGIEQQGQIVKKTQAEEAQKVNEFTDADLKRQVRDFTEKGGISSEVKDQGLRPAFRDNKSGRIFFDPKQIVHNLDIIPDEFVIRKDEGFVEAVKPSIEAGFLDERNRFLTREEAANAAQERIRSQEREEGVSKVETTEDETGEKQARTQTEEVVEPLENRSLAELKELARRVGVKPSGKRKAKLIAEIREKAKTTSMEKVALTPQQIADQIDSLNTVRKFRELKKQIAALPDESDTFRLSKRDLQSRLTVKARGAGLDSFEAELHRPTGLVTRDDVTAAPFPKRLIKKRGKKERFGVGSVGGSRSPRTFLAKFIKTVKEFASDPTFTVLPNGRLQHKDGGTFTIEPELIGIDPDSVAPGQVITIDVESFGVRRKGKVSGVGSSSSTAGFTFEPATEEAVKPGKTPNQQNPQGKSGVSESEVSAGFAAETPRGAENITQEFSREPLEGEGAVVGKTVRNVPMPELVALARQLIGKLPQISRRLRKTLGLFKGTPGTPLTDILINPDAASDPTLLAHVLGHEIGHLIDYLPQNTLKRGNLLGRIASLRENIEKFLAREPGALGVLSEEDIARLEEIARKKQTEGFEQEVELFIEKTFGVRPGDILAIFNSTADVVVNKELEDFIKRLDTADKKSIVGEALKGRVSEKAKQFLTTIRTPTGVKLKVKGRIKISDAQVREELNRLIEEEIKKRRLLSEDAIRKELLALTSWWRGPIKGPPRFIRYRRSSRELFADALSVFLNAPFELKARAPEFYSGFVNYLGEKPKVLDAYLETLELLGGTEEKIAKQRSANIRAMFSKADEVINAAVLSKEEAKMSAGGAVRLFLSQFVVDRLGPAKRKALSVDNETAAFVLDELYQKDSDTADQFNRIDQLLKPLKERGLDRFDVGEFLFLRRVVNERFEIANPLGFDPETSSRQLEAMRTRLGDADFQLLQETMRKVNDIFFETAQKAVDAGIYSKELFESKIKPDKDNYATFAVIKFLEDRIPASVRKQIGTFSEVANPFDATLMKIVSTNRLIRLNKAKQSILFDVLQKYFPTEIEPVRVVRGADGKIVQKAKSGFDFVNVMVDGKLQTFQAPKEIADGFKAHDVGRLAQFSSILASKTLPVYHSVYVTYNPTFGAQNILRDLKRTWKLISTRQNARAKELRKQLIATGMSKADAKKLTDPKKITFGQVLGAFYKALPASRRRALGEFDPIINEMLRNNALPAPFVSLSSQSPDVTRTDKLLKQFLPTFNKPSARNGVTRTLAGALDAVEVFNTTVETASKVAVYRLLKDRGVPTKQAAYDVRKFSGTPDIGQRGLATPILNSWLTYFKVRVNGLQTEAQVAFNPKTAAGYWWRTSLVSFLPKIIALRALGGAFGDYLKELYEKIPDSFLANYNPLPLGVTTAGKVMFLTLAPADADRFLGRVFWHLLGAVFPEKGRGTTGENLNNLMADVQGELVPTLNPFVDIAYKWGQYAKGINPIDSFFGQSIVPQRQWNAGGWFATRKMLSWTFGKTGVINTILHPVVGPLLGAQYDPAEEVGWETTLKSIPPINGLIRISDRGLTEKRWAEIQADDQERERFRLGLPVVVRKMTRDRFFLIRRGDSGLSDAEVADSLVFNQWYGKTYLPMTEAIRDAKDAGRKTEEEAIRKDLEDQTRIVRSWREKGIPEPYLRDIVHRFSYNLHGDEQAKDRRRSIAQFIGESGLERGEAIRLLRKRYKNKRIRFKSGKLTPFGMARQRLANFWPKANGKK